MKRKNNLVIITDLDGTFSKIKPLIESIGIPFYVITGCDNKEVIEFKLKGTSCIKYFIYPGKYCEDLEVYLKKVAVWKAKMVKRLKGSVYIDDDHRVLREVAKLNPRTICLEVF
jgi:hypothetical protein